jgi:hypothetical protein
MNELNNYSRRGSARAAGRTGRRKVEITNFYFLLSSTAGLNGIVVLEVSVLGLPWVFTDNEVSSLPGSFTWLTKRVKGLLDPQNILYIAPSI